MSFFYLFLIFSHYLLQTLNLVFEINRCSNSFTVLNVCFFIIIKDISLNYYIDYNSGLNRLIVSGGYG